MRWDRRTEDRHTRERERVGMRASGEEEAKARRGGKNEWCSLTPGTATNKNELKEEYYLHYWKKIFYFMYLFQCFSNLQQSFVVISTKE